MTKSGSLALALAAALTVLTKLETSAYACVTDGDCPSATAPICGSNAVCRACQTTADCTTKNPLTPNCDTGPSATKGSCFSCATNPSECQAPTPFCQLGGILCVACLNSNNCSGATPVCNVGQGQCVGCQSDFESDGGLLLECSDPQRPACHGADAGALSGECTQCSGTNATQCGGNTPVCVTGMGDCGCTSDSNCNPGQVCDTSKPPAGQCVPGCKVTGGGDTCSTGTYCLLPDGGTIGACVPGCKSNADCMPPTPVCNTTTHTCVAGDAGAGDGGGSNDSGSGDGAAADGALGDGGQTGDGAATDGGGGSPDGSTLDGASGTDGAGGPDADTGGLMEGGGCSCSLLDGPGGPGSFAVLGLLVTGAAWIGRRKRS